MGSVPASGDAGNVPTHSRQPHLLRLLEDSTRAYERVCIELRRDELVTGAQLRSLVTELHRLGRLSGGIVWCTDAHLRDTAGMSKRQVQRVLKVLERAGILTRHGGHLAYWTHRAYGGTARMLGRYRIIVLSAWRPRLAEDFYEARRLATALRRVFRRDWGATMSTHLVAAPANVVPLREGDGDREAQLAPAPLQTSPMGPEQRPEPRREPTEAEYHDKWMRDRTRLAEWIAAQEGRERP